MSRPLRRDLRLAFGVLLAAIAVVGIGGVVATVTTAAYVDRAVGRVVPAQEANQVLLQTMTEIEASRRSFELGGGEQTRRLYQQDLRRLEAHRARLRQLLAADAKAQPFVHRQAAVVNAWLATQDPQAGTRSDTELAAQHALFDEVRQANGALRDHLASRLGDLRDRADTMQVVLAVVVGLLTLAGLAVGVAATRRTSRRVRRPLSELREVLDALIAGDTAARARTDGPLEVATIARWVNALADETDRLREVETADRRLQERLLAFGREVRSSLDPDVVVRRGLRELGEALRLDRAYVRLVAEGELQNPSAEWCAPGLPELGDLETPGSISALEAIYRRGRPMTSTDVLLDPFFETPRGKDWQRRTGARGSMTMPIPVEDAPIGVVTCITHEPHEWTEAEMRLAEAVTADLGRALEHAHLYTAQTAAVQRLEALDRAKTEFLSTVSHELRTPLTSIHGYVELLEDDSNDPQQRRLLGVVRRNVDRLRLLIEDLLTLSRIESGAFRSTMQPVDLVPLLRACVDDLRPQAEKSGVTVGADLPDGELWVQADGPQLSRAVVNVLGNAIKFTPDGGQVEVEVRTDRDGPALYLEIRDTGIGIPEEDLDQVFTRFFRAGNAVTAGVQGTGLGLVIVRTIVDNHGGALDLQSKVGVGTTVTITLPWDVGHEAQIGAGLAAP